MVKASAETQIDELKVKLRKSGDSNMKLLQKLSTQQETVVKPLIAECSNRETKLNQYRDLSHDLGKHVKMLRAIVHFPALCQQLRLACIKASTSKHEQKSEVDQAVHILRTYGLDEQNENTEDQLNKLAQELE